LRNLLRHLFDGMQDFRRDSFANAEVFAFDSIDPQGARKQFKNAAEVIASATPKPWLESCAVLCDRAHMLQKQTGFRRKHSLATSSFWDMRRVGELESEYALW
jgi:hypothetical protein